MKKFMNTDGSYYVTSQSEKRKQDLLAKIVLEEQRGRGLSKIVKEMLPDTKKKELLPDPKKNAVEKPARARRVLSFAL